MSLPHEYQDAHRFSFGDDPKMADSGLRDVIARKQVATCGAYETLSQDEFARPFEGKIEVVLDGSGEPGCAIKLTGVDTKPFSQIDHKFATDEACRDLAEWKSSHQAYFSRKGCFAPDMKIYRIYFDVVAVFSDTDEVS